MFVLIAYGLVVIAALLLDETLDTALKDVDAEGARGEREKHPIVALIREMLGIRPEESDQHEPRRGGADA